MLIIARLLVLLLLISLALVTNQAYAAQESKFEITPLVGYRFGGDFDSNDAELTTTVKLTEDINYGLLFAWNVDRKRQGEVLISHNNTEFSLLGGSSK